MQRQIIRMIWLTLWAAATPAFAVSVDNFVLLDHQGTAHELYYHRQAPAVVIMLHDTQCTHSTAEVAQFARLQARYQEAGVRFYLLSSSAGQQRTELAASAAALEIRAPILDDRSQIVGEGLGFAHSGEALIINPETWEAEHRGHINTVAPVLAGMLSTPPPVHTPAAGRGCEVSFPDPSNNRQISYSRDIAPLLQEKCTVCHRDGGLGPWAMSDYNMVKGFAPMIREVVRTKRMPPWHADPNIGRWKNDSSLSAAQTGMLVRWIEAGAPRGPGEDPLAAAIPAAAEWPLGPPDLVLDIPPYTVPASGVVNYQFPTVANPLDTGVWVRAATVVPGDREVVHHILAGTIDADATQLRRDSGVFDNYLIGYAPGNESHEFPPGTGVYIAPGGEFLFQLHYTPVGRETVDRSRIGLYFHKDTPANYFRQGVVIDPTIRIPPRTSRHEETAYYEFPEDALLHNLVPHAHYRGVASKFELWQPDGSKKLLLSVPNYDFNWQRTYQFAQPQHVSAGSRLVHTTFYDNSADHPRNPDPTREVPWGLQSWDEMLYGAFSYTVVNESTSAPTHDRLLARTAQFVGFLDADLDGRLSWRELPRELKKRLVQGFKAVDRNGDGGLDLQEMHEITLRRQQAAQQAGEAR